MYYLYLLLLQRMIATSEEVEAAVVAAQDDILLNPSVRSLNPNLTCLLSLWMIATSEEVMDCAGLNLKI
jgi:hypothetical protein